MSMENFAGFFGSPVKSPLGLDIASANDITLTHPIHKVTGTIQVNRIGVPYAGFKGMVVIIPTGAYAYATGGTETDTLKPMVTAYTAVANRPHLLVCDGNSWYVMAIA